MLTVILLVAIIVCAIQWLGNNLAVGGLVLYMAEKGYTPPTKRELRACIKKVARQKFPWAL